MFEVCTQARAYAGVPTTAQIIDIVKEGGRPPIPQELSDQFVVTLVQMCWRQGPRDRPTIFQVAIMLDENSKGRRCILDPLANVGAGGDDKNEVRDLEAKMEKLMQEKESSELKQKELKKLTQKLKAEKDAAEAALKLKAEQEEERVRLAKQKVTLLLVLARIGSGVCVCVCGF
jgi:hypothetical protein